MNLIPNVPPKAFTLSSVVVGFLLIDDLNANEQNALGNWLMLVAQLLCTNAAYLQLQQERATGNSNNVTNGIPGHPDNNQNSTQDTINMLEKMVKALQKEVGDLKKSL